MDVSTFDDERYEMFIDKEYHDLFQGLKTPWLEASYSDWRASGIDATLFPRGVPMKRVLLEDGENKHTMALMYFAMAHRSGKVNGVPYMLISMRMAPEDVMQGIWNKTLQAYPEQETLAFLKTLTPEYYPRVRDWQANPITSEMGEQFLQLGYELLQRSAAVSKKD